MSESSSLKDRKAELFLLFNPRFLKSGVEILLRQNLCHTNAALQIMSHQEIRTISARLGHSQTSTALNVYAHAIQSVESILNKWTPKRRHLLMSAGKTGTRYDEDFKRTLVSLYQSGGKSQAALCKEYGVSITPYRNCTCPYSKYIEGYYNSRRPHGSLQMLTPNEKEELLWNQA